MKAEQFKEGGLSYTVRHLSKEEFEKEFPDSEEEQEMPTTDVGGDPEENEGENETASQLADAFKRVANGHARRSDIRDASRLHVSEKKATEPAPTPEATRKPNETSDALAKVMERIRSLQ